RVRKITCLRQQRAHLAEPTEASVELKGPQAGGPAGGTVSPSEIKIGQGRELARAVFVSSVRNVRSQRLIDQPDGFFASSQFREHARFQLIGPAAVIGVIGGLKGAKSRDRLVVLALHKKRGALEVFC